MTFDAELFRRLLESSPEGVALIDAQAPDQPVLYMNSGFSTLTGYQPAELIGKNLRLLQGEDREQDGRHRLREAIRLGESCRVLLRNYRKDGTLFWNDLTMLPLKEPEGRLTHFAGLSPGRRRSAAHRSETLARFLERRAPADRRRRAR